MYEDLCNSRGPDQTVPVLYYCSTFWYVQADLRLCRSHIPHCWKSHALAPISVGIIARPRS